MAEDTRRTLLAVKKWTGKPNRSVFLKSLLDDLRPGRRSELFLFLNDAFADVPGFKISRLEWARASAKMKRVRQVRDWVRKRLAAVVLLEIPQDPESDPTSSPPA